jgi:hypothetical protein
MNTKKTKLTELVFDNENARRHSEENKFAVKTSLEKYGQQKPIVINEDKKIIAGNCTAVVAKELGWETVDTVTTKLTAEQATAYAIADNRTSELGEWEGDVLKFLVESNEIDLDSIGFDVDSFNIATGEMSWDEEDRPNVDEEVQVPTVKIQLSLTDWGRKQEVIDAISNMIYDNSWGDFLEIK